jgi:hypothetical protein
MESDPPTPNDDPPTPDEEPIAQESDFSLEEYDKRRRRIRNTLFVISGMTLFALAEVIIRRGRSPGIFWIVVLTLLSVAYAGLGLWSMKKPFDALIAAICVYCGFILLNEVVVPGSISHGIIYRIAIMLVLVGQLNIARDCQRMLDAARNL